jgi:methionyl-tRNA synthetase
MSDSKATENRFYLTTPIYYVNARPHLGHAYSTIVCDSIARRKRALGVDTWFLTGTDEHGQKIERSAKLAGRTPKEFADTISGEFRGLWDRLGLSYDDFIRTTEDRHKRGVQKLFKTLIDRGYIYKGSYTGQYCVSDEAWVDVAPGAPCPDCGRITETVSEENYFFKLSAFEHKLLEFYEANPEFMQPESTRREVISFVRSGLKDLSVSRASFTWGIPVPGDEKQVIYVWLDALANYMTALGYGSDDPKDQARFAKFWPADIHLIGKEISRFHCVYWPAFLMAAGLPTPRSVRANGWLMFDQSKMSKSRGNIVRAETVDAVLGIDALRYFLLREIPFGQDGNFTFDALVQRYNADLANGYGNLVSRVVNMMHKFFGGVVPEPGAETAAEATLRAHTEKALAEFGPLFDALNFSEALRLLWSLVAETDGYLTANAPWKKPADRSDADHAALQARVLATAAEAIRVITALVYPILPGSAAKVWAQLGQGDIAEAAKHAYLTSLAWGGLKPGTKFLEPAPLFPRAEKDAIDRMQNMEDENNLSAVEAASGTANAEPAAPETVTTPTEMPAAEAVAVPEAPGGRSPEITIDDFAKVELRVAQVLVAERVPKADKLLRLEVDLGYEKRQILAGIAQYYEPEKLIGRKIVIVANLAPRKMRGLESNGMLLAASLPDGAPVLTGFLEEVPLGARLK